MSVKDLLLLITQTFRLFSLLKAFIQERKIFGSGYLSPTGLTISKY